MERAADCEPTDGTAGSAEDEGRGGESKRASAGSTGRSLRDRGFSERVIHMQEETLRFPVNPV